VRRPAFSHHEVRDGLANLSTAAMVFALNMLLSLFTLGTVYARGRQTVLSLFNADPASYALHAQHLLEGGFRGAGPIVGYNIGAGEKTLGFGADAFIANVAAFLRTDALHVLHVAMLVAMFLGVYGLVRLLNGRLGVSRPIAILAAQTAYAVFFVAYLQGNYFLSQMLSMALLPAFLTLLIDLGSADSWRKFVSAVLAVGALSAAGIALYPQLSLATAALFVPAAALSGRLSGLIGRAARGVLGLACGIGLGAAVDPALSRLGWHLAVYLSTAQAGWPMSRLLLPDLLGFQTSTPPQHPLPRHSVFAWLLSGAILLGVAATSWWLWRRPEFRELAAFASVSIVIVVSSYLVVFWYEGASYQQWKWVTYFIPLFVAVVVAQTLSALSLVDRRVDGRSAALAAGTAYLFTVTTLAGPASFPVGASPAAYYAVSEDAAAAATSAQVKALPSVNINVTSEWETMWLAYLLRHKEQLYLVSPSYFPTAKPQADWTIERNDMPTTTTRVIPLGATYRLAYHPRS
jgi:hypothetical protein